MKMLIDINKIIVNDRIRKDFGNLEELAEDIKENGLINPPVVNKSYVLLAGERRLKACKLLGWPTIEVRMMDTRDAEHELNIEISENDVRKGFSKSERLDYIQRLYRIEQAKAKERQDLGLKSDKGSRADDATAKQFGIGRDTMRRELFISDNRDLLDPADFAEWDEGKLSTNKAFQRIKAAMAQAEKERDEARQEMQDVYLASENMEREVESLRKQLAKRPKPEVIEREVEVVREVVPEDVQKRINSLERENRQLNDEYQHMWKKKRDLDKKLDQANELLGEKKRNHEATRDIEQLTIATNSYLRNYGGKAWAFDQFDRVDEITQREFEKAITSMASFAQNLMAMIQDRKQLGA